MCFPGFYRALVTRRKGLLVVLALILILAATVGLAWTPFLKAFHAHQEEEVLDEPIKGKLMRIRLPSRTLRRTNTVFVYLPPNYDAKDSPYPVVYLLHGFPGEARDWFVKGQAHITTERKILAGNIPPMILVSFDAAGPNGPHDATQFLNRPDGKCSVEDYVTRELPEQIESRYNADNRPEGRALIGLSSGGYGAVNIGMKHPDIFRVLVSHSGFFQLADDASATKRWLGPNRVLWDVNDPFKKAGDWNKDTELHLYLDCGKSDDLLDENVRFSKRLGQLGIDHIFKAYPGSHHWSYWSKHFADSIQFTGDRLVKLRQSENAGGKVD